MYIVMLLALQEDNTSGSFECIFIVCLNISAAYTLYTKFIYKWLPCGCGLKVHIHMITRVTMLFRKIINMYNINNIDGV